MSRREKYVCDGARERRSGRKRRKGASVICQQQQPEVEPLSLILLLIDSGRHDVVAPVTPEVGKHAKRGER